MLEFIAAQDRSGFDISGQVQQILRDQEIDDDGPGTILQDFETLLHFIGDDGLKTTGKYQFLPQSKLDELNLQMSHPVMHRLKRPQQRSFPHLHGLYLVLRASGMATGVGASPSGRLMLDQETVISWRDLNPTERYFALLESWLVHGSPEIIAERGSWASSCMTSLTDVAFRLRDRRMTDHDRRGGLLYATMGMTTAALMELFGWVRLEFAEPEAGESVRVTAIERRDWGDAMVNALNAAFLSRRWPTFDEEGPVEGSVMQPLFQPYFPEYQRTLAQKEWPYRDGTFTWRVSLGKAWRRIAASDDVSLDDLAMTILKAFEFDSDHLYCFELRQPNGRTLRIACPYEDDAVAFTDEVALGDLPIAEGGSMKMIFDYGESWRFDIKLEEIGPPAESDGPRILAQGGKPPAQYDWEDEDDY